MGRQVRREAVTIDQQRFRRAADSRAAHLGVQCHIPRHRHSGRAVHIHMAQPLQVADHGHPRIGLDPRNQIPAAPGHDDIHELLHVAQQVAHGVPAGGGDHLDGRLRQAAGPEALHRRGVVALRWSWKDSEPTRRIPRLPSLRHKATSSAVTLGRLS